MSGRKERNIKTSKRAAAHISKFHYHLEHTVPECFPTTIGTQHNKEGPILQTKKGLRNTTFHYAEHSTDGVGTIDAEAILLSALKIYVGSDSVKLSDTSYKKTKRVKTPYLPQYGVFQEIVQFYIVDKNQDYHSVNITRCVKKANLSKKDRQCESALLQSTVKKALSNNFQLFVIHHCNSEGGDQDLMNWQNFIERYHFTQENEGGQLKAKIHYNLIFNYQEDKGLLSYFSSKDKLYDTFITEHLSQKQGELHNITLFQGYLLQSKDRVVQKLKNLNDPAYDQSNKKWLKLSPQYFKMFSMLKNHAVTQHKLLYGDQEHLTDIDLSSLAYRYMIAKDYNYKEAQEHITQYLAWEKQLSEKYTLLNFEKYHKDDFYTFLGHDKQGRCVILNKASHLLVDKIQSVQDYCDYFCYFNEVYIRRHLKGYADQYVVIGDLEGLNSDNYKLAITKRNMADGLKYCPERQYKFIAINTNKFAYYLWYLFKTLLPKNTVDKVNIFGAQQKQQLLQFLLEQMDIQVIPEYLGGKNKRTYMDDLNEQRFICQDLELKKHHTVG